MALLLCCLVSAGTAKADESTLPAFTLNDAQGKAHTLDDSVRRIYANADRSGDKLLKAALAEAGQAALDAQGAIVVADISGAPGFVKGFIKSSLRDRHYVTWLDVMGTTRGALPYREDQVAVIELEGRRVKAIRYVGDLEALKRELQPRPATP